MMKYEMELKNILKDVMEEDLDNINLDEDTQLIGGSLGISSMDYVELLVSVENEFDITFDFQTKIESVRDLIDYIDGEKEAI